MTYIELSGKRGKGHRAIVDEETYNKYGHLTWFLSDTGYAMRRPVMDDGSKVTIRLHRLVAEAPEGMVVDHLNGNKLDNRKANLRVCTQAENSRNKKKTIGYCYDNNRGRYIVRYGKTFYGRYDTEKEAQRAYQLAKSGVPYNKTRRKLYMLPKHISKQFGTYRVGIQLNGKRYRKTGFKTIEEAVSWRDNKYAELRLEKEK